MHAVDDAPASTRRPLMHALVLAALLGSVAGCTYSGAKRGDGKTYQPSTADPYTSEFQHRIPPGGD